MGATFGGAFLLFIVEPMVGRMLLPTLGGAPSVWNVCLVFFQACLLLGYAWADFLGRRSVRAALLAQAGLGLAAGACLPVTIPAVWLDQPWRDAYPAVWLLAGLALALGLPFVFLSSLGPLLQRWFARVAGRQGDPYSLYAASNLGSFGALLLYPVAVDPWVGLRVQGFSWAAGFGVVACLVLMCGWTLWRCGGRPAHGPSCPADPVGGTTHDSVRTRCVTPAVPWLSGLWRGSGTGGSVWESRGGWFVLSMVPSVMLMGATAYLTADIASLPLLWVAPLALYLLSFSLAFSRWSEPATRLCGRALPFAGLGLLFLVLGRATEPIWLLLIVHLGVLFLAAIACHGRLAAGRPAVERLTEFYLWLSAGGVAGGMFATFAAPRLFTNVIEYPLALCAAIALGAVSSRARAVAVAAGGFCSDAGGPEESMGKGMAWRWAAALALTLGVCLAGRAGLQSWPTVQSFVVAGVPLIGMFVLFSSSGALGMGCALAVTLTAALGPAQAQVVHRERNAFGITTVQFDPAGNQMRLIHGNTVHGRQFRDDARRCQPLAYYHRQGPLGEVFGALTPLPAGVRRVGVVGLGAGAMVAYAAAGENWAFFEIDPAVIRVATDPAMFSYLAGCAPAGVRVVRGDARLTLGREPPGGFDLLVLDAFSSDSIPTHLLTLEALELYVAKLAPGGVLAFHISNRYLDLEPVLGELGYAAGLVALGSIEGMTAEPQPEGMDPARWVVMARQRAELGALGRSPYWRALERRPGRVAWTDDFSDPIRALHWW